MVSETLRHTLSYQGTMDDASQLDLSTLGGSQMG